MNSSTYEATDTFSSTAAFAGDGAGRSSFRLATGAAIEPAVLVCGVSGSAGRGELVADTCGALSAPFEGFRDGIETETFI